MNDFHNELQMLNVGDFNSSQAVSFDPNASFSNSTALLPIIGIGGGIGRCSSCFSCASCFFFSCFNCFNCFRCSNCFRCHNCFRCSSCGGRCHG
ncbi:heterocycloanthracin/sonorensin family bacteriocin [Sporosarcina luteola]|uniref:heterocycloanthracin/sonorensin family bacteriocin n=1 Tax=Sporosarcina luteola TaxID=582850 RepID=UPI00333EB7B9